MVLHVSSIIRLRYQIFGFWAADPKGAMSYRTEGGISVRLSKRANRQTNERTSEQTNKRTSERKLPFEGRKFREKRRTRKRQKKSWLTKCKRPYAIMELDGKYVVRRVGASAGRCQRRVTPLASVRWRGVGANRAQDGGSGVAQRQCAVTQSCRPPIISGHWTVLQCRDAMTQVYRRRRIIIVR